MSKQALNQLLRSLECLGYIERSDAPDAGRARIIRLTKRGRAAFAKVHDILRDIEREWSAELGHQRFAQLSAKMTQQTFATLSSAVSKSFEQLKKVG